MVHIDIAAKCNITAVRPQRPMPVALECIG